MKSALTKKNVVEGDDMLEMSASDRRLGDRRQVGNGAAYAKTVLHLPAKSDRDTEVDVALIGQFGEIGGLTVALLQRDIYTRHHVLHVNRLAARFLDRMPELSGGGEDEGDVFLQAALLHDVGKVVVRDELLMAPRSLDGEEYAEMKLHVDYGVRLLAPYPRLKRVRELVLQHHEWWNGQGYPRGLQGEQIDPLARALAVLDAFSAMTVDRPYHRADSDDDAIAELQRCAGTQFDPYFVDRFSELRRAIA